MKTRPLAEMPIYLGTCVYSLNNNAINSQHKFYYHNFCPDHRMSFATVNSKNHKSGI
jgi:hypothetical protein